MKINKKEVAFYELEGLLEDFYVMVLDEDERLVFYLGHYDNEDIMFLFCSNPTSDEQKIIALIEDDIDYSIKDYVRSYTNWDEAY
ncbi:MAG: hypothetical protein U0K54_03375 [Acutalibacteraceae bacterium]|nr:hypothetical protein [Acutalibacteraceae bacterium]